MSTVMLLSAAPADSIIGGQPDGSRHPYVGAIDVRPTGRTIPASGVLISPTVYVTAGHVTHFFDQAGITRANVTVDSVYGDSATFFQGSVHTHPGFRADPQSSHRRDDPHDIGVVVFDAPIPGITPATLPAAGLLDQLGPQRLSQEVFPVVGYGISRLTGAAEGGGPPGIDRSSAGTRTTGDWRFLSPIPTRPRPQCHHLVRVDTSGPQRAMVVGIPRASPSPGRRASPMRTWLFSARSGRRRRRLDASPSRLPRYQTGTSAAQWPSHAVTAAIPQPAD